MTADLRSLRGDLIRIAAQLVRGEGVPDWSGHKFYRSTPRGEQREMLKALRDADEALRRYGIQLKEIADKLPVGSSGETATEPPPWKCRFCSHWNDAEDRECDFCPDGRQPEKTGCSTCGGAGRVNVIRIGNEVNVPCPDCSVTRPENPR
jgi:hypothetical protein